MNGKWCNIKWNIKAWYSTWMILQILRCFLVLSHKFFLWKNFFSPDRPTLKIFKKLHETWTPILGWVVHWVSCASGYLRIGWVWHWVTCILGDLYIGWLAHWVTEKLGDLGCYHHNTPAKQKLGCFVPQNTPSPWTKQATRHVTHH